MNGQISRDDNVLVANIDVDVHGSRRGELLEWSGSFDVPHGIQFDDDEYTLELADGRTGQILVLGASIAGGPPTKRVRFQGTGPLHDKKVI